jgi:hypothetical protein
MAADIFYTISDAGQRRKPPQRVAKMVCKESAATHALAGGARGEHGVHGEKTLKSL